jgi:hypothetical protein
MRRWRMSVAGAITLGILGWPGLVAAQSELLTEPRGSKVEVRAVDGSTVRGRFVAASPDWLEVSVRQELRRLPLDQVDRVSRLEPDSLLNGTLIGMAVGFGAGLAVVGSVCGTVRTNDECGAIGMIVITWPAIGTGAGLGALADHLVPERVTLFRRDGTGARLRIGVDARPQRAAVTLALSY